MKERIVLTLWLVKANLSEFKNAPIGAQAKIHTPFCGISHAIFHSAALEDRDQEISRGMLSPGCIVDTSAELLKAMIPRSKRGPSTFNASTWKSGASMSSRPARSTC